MTVSSQLLVAGGAAYIVLGGAHVIWAVADIRRPRRFAPSDRSVQEGMARSTVRVTANRTTMWDAWLGFNISHGLGALIFGSVLLVLGGFEEDLATPLVLTLLIGVSLVYLALAIRFWFYLPVLGIGLATACLCGSLAFAMMGG